MGLAFTIDSPIKVARFGISSVISLVEDNLIEKMRKYYYEKINEEYKPINRNEDDYRARRITDYLNLVNMIVQKQFEKLKNSPFDNDSELVQYFEMLPDNSNIKQLYNQMSFTKDEKQKTELQNILRNIIHPGSIDVNVISKIDKNNYNSDNTPITNGSDALSALRGYAKSTLKNSSVIFSAGLSTRLYNYIETFNQFTDLNNGQFDKKIAIKVSDYRSAYIQGSYLAKRGIWVSEYRIESGLNCGGHTFITKGSLMGPVLEEFKNKRQELINEMFDIYVQALKLKGKVIPSTPPELKITVQGGIGTHKEDKFLHKYYNVNSTGWGTPFLLVPEATTVDEKTLQLLCDANENDVEHSIVSPLGIQFNYLKGASKGIEKQTNISKEKYGNCCSEQLLVTNTEFTEKPICIASSKYQKQKLKQLKTLNLSEEVYKKKYNEVVSKECLCVGLSNSAVVNYKLEPFEDNSLAISICPGPNIAYFSKIASLKEMVDHIYGRINLLTEKYRVHFFIKELKLYVDYLVEKFNESKNDIDEKIKKFLHSLCETILKGIQYYKGIIDKLVQVAETTKEIILKDLLCFEEQVKGVMVAL
jgi:hypothetical protein